MSKDKVYAYSVNGKAWLFKSQANDGTKKFCYSNIPVELAGYGFECVITEDDVESEIGDIGCQILLRNSEFWVWAFGDDVEMGTEPGLTTMKRWNERHGHEYMIGMHEKIWDSLQVMARLWLEHLEQKSNEIVQSRESEKC